MLLYPFIIRTLIIRQLGADFLGLSSLFSSILQVLNLTELGFASSIVFSMYKPIANDDEMAISAILNYFRKVYCCIGLIILLLGFVILPFIPYLIKGDVPNINIFCLYIIYLVGTSISYFLFAYKSSLLIAYQRNDVINNINTVVFLITYTLQLGIIILTKNYYLYAVANLINSILVNLLTAYFTKKMFPNISCRGKISELLKSDIEKKVLGLGVAKVSTVSRNSLDSIFISVYLGLIEIAIYNNYYYILSAISGFIIIIFTSMSAGVGNSVSTEAVDKNYTDMNIFNFMYMWIVGFCAICLLCLYQPFTLLIWGKDMLFPYSTVILFCVYFYVLRINDMLGLYYDANGLWWKGKKIYTMETVFNIFLNALFGFLWGVNGIVFATLLSVVVTTNIFLPLIVYRDYFKEFSVGIYFKRHLLYFIVTFLTGLVVYGINSSIKLGGIIGFLLKVLVCIFLINALFFIFYHKTKEFKKAKLLAYTKFCYVK